MEHTPPPSSASPDIAVHEELRAKLRARYGLRGEYVSAPTVALILGLGRTTVHDQVKAHRFVIPHRLVNRKPIFLLDELVAWMAGRAWPEQPEKPELARPSVRSGAEAPAYVFTHASAEEAFLRMCEKRGIPPPSGLRADRALRRRC